VFDEFEEGLAQLSEVMSIGLHVVRVYIVTTASTGCK